MGSSDPLAIEVILFDGVCNLCNSSVQFIIQHDKKGRYKFSALQSPFGQDQLQKFGISPSALSSVILIRESIAYQKSDAALEIARGFSGFWSALYVFKILPRFFRNWIYDLIAKNRYSLFGKRNECMIPTPELKSRFILN